MPALCSLEYYDAGQTASTLDFGGKFEHYAKKTVRTTKSTCATLPGVHTVPFREVGGSYPYCYCSCLRTVQEGCLRHLTCAIRAKPKTQFLNGSQERTKLFNHACAFQSYRFNQEEASQISKFEGSVQSANGPNFSEQQ
jgi:hypothetical protein